MGKDYECSEQEIKDMLQSIENTLKHIETVLLRMDAGMHAESAEEFYKKHGVTQTFS